MSVILHKVRALQKRKRDRNISKTCVFIFHHSIQHGEASGHTSYNSNYLNKRSEEYLEIRE